MATQVTTNCNRIQQGIAEKLSSVIQALSTFVAAFVVAMIIQWKLALITLSIVPLIFLVSGLCVAIDVPQEAKIVRLYSQASTIAQESLSSIKILHAFEARERAVDKYDDILRTAHDIGKKKSPNFGALFCTQYFAIYAGIALCFWQGFRMYQSGEIDNPGQVFKYVFHILLSTHALCILTTFAAWYLQLSLLQRPPP